MNIKGQAKATDYRVLNEARREHEVMRAMQNGAVYRSVLLHRLGVSNGSLQRTLNALEEDGLIARRYDANNRMKFELLPAENQKDEAA